MNTDLSKFDNSWFKPSSTLKRFIWYFKNLVLFKSSLPWPNAIKVFTLRIFGAKVGKRVLIKPNVNIKYPWSLEIGDNVWIGERVWIDNLGKVKIGNNVWISLGSVVLRGVTIGDNSTISAQSVVYNDVPENCVYGGNPAVLIKKIEKIETELETGIE